MAQRTRIAFFAEAVTLAHVARPIALASALDANRYEVFFLCDPRYRAFVPADIWSYRCLNSISRDQFLHALAMGRPVYDSETLARYVRDDLAVLEDLRPDLVIGDFRLSLSISARIAHIPYVTITSAYWSPLREPIFPIPDHPLVRAIGVAAAQRVFDLARPTIFAWHAKPLNRVRRQFGLGSLGRDLRRIYTDADLVLYADPRELVPLPSIPKNHHYLGPVLWSPPVRRPPWWDAIPGDKPTIYVTMGSSGSAKTLNTVLRALSSVRCYVLVSGVGAAQAGGLPPDVFAADYLPGIEAASRARLVICNGGSPTTHQALAVGTPVIGIPENMDQHLNMCAVIASGAGLLIRSDQAREASVLAAVRNLLHARSFADAARQLANAFDRYDAPKTFLDIIERQTHPPGPSSGVDPALLR